MAKNPYEILGVSPRNTKEEVHKAYRKLAKKYHPDIAGKEFNGKFQEINEAWEALEKLNKFGQKQEIWVFSTLFNIEKRSY